MKSLLEYIMLNYTWFLGGAIIILLAIIGSYADKTNFGQGKDNNKENEEDFIDDNIQIENSTDFITQPVIENESKTAETQDVGTTTVVEESILNPIQETPSISEVENNVLEMEL